MLQALTDPCVYTVHLVHSIRLPPTHSTVPLAKADTLFSTSQGRDEGQWSTQAFKQERNSHDERWLFASVRSIHFVPGGLCTAYLVLASSSQYRLSPFISALRPART